MKSFITLKDRKMKYNILINQKNIMDLNLDIELDLQDAAILNFMLDFSHNSNCMKMQKNNETYYWFSYQIIIEELPMLRIKTRQGLNKKLEKLEKALMIERFEDNKIAKKSFFKFGENAEKILFCNKTNELATNVACNTEILATNVACTSNKCCMDNTIIYNTIKKDTEVSKEKTSFSSDDLKDLWNKICKSYSKARKINVDSFARLKSQMKKNELSFDDIKKAMMILESLDVTNHFKGNNDRKWKADINWFMCNTKGCLLRLLNGELSYSNAEIEVYKQIIDSNEIKINEEYVPRGGINLLQDKDGIYRCHEDPERNTIYDGYSNENRPKGTLIKFLSKIYAWDKENKRWIFAKNDL